MPEQADETCQEQLQKLQEACTRLRRGATIIERTDQHTTLRWDNADVDQFIAAAPIEEDFMGR